MKIVSWNCSGKFREKFRDISALDADIYVIQECENPAECTSVAYKAFAQNYIWTGESKNKGLCSAYHHQYQEHQGKESVPTFYLYRHLDKGYHIDHCFTAPQNIQSYKVLDSSEWLSKSDHMPVCLECIEYLLLFRYEGPLYFLYLLVILNIRLLTSFLRFWQILPT